MITFTRRKQDCLKKDDKSSIGEWDPHILELCEKINKKANFYTLSSCAGRIVLIKNLVKKGPDMFVFRSHEKVSFSELKKALENYKGKDNLMFKQETCILHVCCEKIEDAENLLKIAREAGWKNSGIMSTQGRIVCELRSTEYLAFPIFVGGKILVDDDFLRVVVSEANEKLERSWQKIRALEKFL
jgi:tRNA wybutosine-synthesizing protein 3